jgi:hypothetical protein
MGRPFTDSSPMEGRYAGNGSGSLLVVAMSTTALPRWFVSRGIVRFCVTGKL